MSRKVLVFIALLSSVTGAFAQIEVGYVRLADGFDFPVGKPDGDGYYKARGFRLSGHVGEDWNGLNGGNSDLGATVSAVGHGIVVHARDARGGWGNVVIIRHSFMENGRIQTIDSLYGHLNQIDVREGQNVSRGQKVGTIGTNRGMYPAHLHFEIHKNLSMGTSRAAFSRDLSNWSDPTKFIQTHRALQSSSKTYPVAMNTFTSATKGGAPSKPTSSRSGGFKVNRFSDLEGRF